MPKRLAGAALVTVAFLAVIAGLSWATGLGSEQPALIGICAGLVVVLAIVGRWK